MKTAEAYFYQKNSENYMLFPDLFYMDMSAWKHRDRADRGAVFFFFNSCLEISGFSINIMISKNMNSRALTLLQGTLGLNIPREDCC